MSLAIEEHSLPARALSRWRVAYAWLAGLAIYLGALHVAVPSTAIWINDLAWTVASAAAAILCFRTAGRLDAGQREPWRLFGLGCSSWFIGQMHWNYSQLVLGIAMPFPSIGQIFYTALAVFTIAGIVRLKDSQPATPFTLKHLGNIALVTCCLAVSMVLGLLEHALQSGASIAYLAIGFIHSLLVAGTFLVALYALWRYQWLESWLPMLLLVSGSGIYSLSNLMYTHAVLIGSYVPSDLINASWLVVFGFFAAAASERLWMQRHPAAGLPYQMQAHERWIEAVIPALLIIIMVIVALSGVDSVTPRVVVWSAALFILFAIVLGAREAWIKREAQQLTHDLISANRQLKTTNADLRLSEARFRQLNAVLEHRVAERTAQLKGTYDELENFSYAVAHDLKAPLRAINSYAQLLQEEFGTQLGQDARNHIDRIRANSLRMAALIDDLLAYSHIDQRGLQAQRVALQSLIQSIVAQYTDEIQRRNAVVILEVPDLRVNLDVEGLSLALRNLLQNALKYARPAVQPYIEITARHGAEGLSVAVIDNGIGFEMQYHEKIFKVFQRLHREDQYPGTGIGLALVRKAVERLGGRVWARSAPEQGASFYIELPQSVIATDEWR